MCSDEVIIIKIVLENFVLKSTARSVDVSNFHGGQLCLTWKRAVDITKLKFLGETTRRAHKSPQQLCKGKDMIMVVSWKHAIKFNQCSPTSKGYSEGLKLVIKQPSKYIV